MEHILLSPDSNKHSTLFPTHDKVLLYHNIDHVICVERDLQLKAAKHYDQRGGHSPTFAGSHGMYFPYHLSDTIKRQINYLSSSTIFDRKISIVTPDILDQWENSLVIPYLRSFQVEKELATNNFDFWGIQPQITYLLKDKAQAKKILASHQIPTPEFRICKINNLIPTALSFAREIEKIYVENDVSQYPIGLFIKQASSDGGYGSYVIKPATANTYICLPNGKGELAQRVLSKQIALEKAKQHLHNTYNPQYGDSIVIERLVDIIDTPSIQFAIMEGEVQFICLSDQIINQGGTACVGTRSYHLRKIQHQYTIESYIDTLQEWFKIILNAACNKAKIKLKTITGVACLDLAIPGLIEQKIWQRRGYKIPPPLIIEINPRITNTTDALMTIARIQKQEISIPVLQDIQKNGFLAIDEIPLNTHKSETEVREQILRLDEEMYCHYNTRVILRMYDNPMGIIFAGSYVQKVAKIVMEKLKSGETEK